MAALTALTVAAIGASAIGGVTSIVGAGMANSANQKILQGEQQIEAQRFKAMKLKADRDQMQALRTQQQAVAMGLTNANAQGANLGSGVQGGAAEIMGQTGQNLLGITQNEQIGTNIFGINQQITGARMDLANAQTVSSIGQGLSSFGGSLMNAAPAFGRLSQGFNNPYSGGFNARGLY